jgi:UDPglucose 6-dehydrogenase
MTDDVEVADNPLKAADGVAALVVLTEWPEFRVLDWGHIAELVVGRVVVDTRNLLDPDVLRRVGFDVHGVGC